ncbi:MAG: DUF4446 family protein [Clostridia bacterium]
MSSLYGIISNNIPLIITVTLFMLLIMTILLIWNIIALARLKRRYRRLTRGIENKNFEELFLEHLKRMEASLETVRKSNEDIREITQRLKHCIQKVGCVRYNPFDDMGGDYSFSVALLNEDNDGIVLTGLYSRNGSSIFSKPINGGTSSIFLSDEEKKAIEMAQSSVQ